MGAAAPASDAAAQASVRYVVEDAPSGYGDAADRLVRATRATRARASSTRGWSATALGASPAFLPCSRDERPDERVAAGAPTVAHLIPEHYPQVRQVAREEAGSRAAGPLVGHTVWETDRLPQHWPALLNTVDLVIVPTEWNRGVFAASGVQVPLAVVPHVATAPAPGDRGAGLGLRDDHVVFYTIGRWDERKAVFRTVQAFLHAFTADDPVTLVVKTGTLVEMPPSDWGAQSPLAHTTAWQLAGLVHHHRNPPHVQLEVDTWPQDRIDGLHHRGDCYVTVARGEGWGMGAFDATAHGNPVIATGWGGFCEYLARRRRVPRRSRARRRAEQRAPVVLPRPALGRGEPRARGRAPPRRGRRSRRGARPGAPRADSGAARLRRAPGRGPVHAGARPARLNRRRAPAPT